MPRTAARAFHPDLRAGRLIPPIAFGPRSVALPNRWTPDPGPTDPAPLVLWVHGDGLVPGSPVQDDGTAAAFVRELLATQVRVLQEALTAPAASGVSS